MVASHKGDVQLVVDDRTYTLRYSHSALYSLEKKTGKGLMQIMREMETAQDMRIGNVIELLWAGLQKHHPGMSLDDACELLDDIEGGSMAVMSVIGDAFQKAFNAPGSRSTNPPQKEQNGTGTSYSSNMPVSVTSLTPSGT